jgi:hypothetical protein
MIKQSGGRTGIVDGAAVDSVFGNIPTAQIQIHIKDQNYQKVPPTGSSVVVIPDWRRTEGGFVMFSECS